MTQEGFPAERIDTSKPHPARMYDYYLGGKDNYEVDREAAQRVIDAIPDMPYGARANRDFLQRAVRHLARSGIRQFIDIGTGIPTSPNTHEVAQSVVPDAHVVYVDNDPIVATHAGARMVDSGRTGFFLGDVRSPRTILEHPSVAELIDFDQPVALLLVAVLHFVTDDENPAGILAELREKLPAGSHLVLSHATEDFHRGRLNEAYKVYTKATATLNTRGHAEVLALLDGFELLEPGLVQVPLWRPDGAQPTAEDLAKVGFYGAVGRTS